MYLEVLGLRKYLRGVLIVFIMISISVTAFLVYTNIYYRASSEVNDILKTDYVSVIPENDMIIFRGEGDSDIGLVFYPGGKVEYKSYIPLMQKLSKRGVSSVLVEMPFNLAVFDKDAAEMAFKELPQINNWFIGGHSLGGAMASNYLNDADVEIKGLILLGSYAVEDSSVPTLIVYGSEDSVLDKTKVDSSKEDVLEIKGGNHAYFGNYGEQKGDGSASISREQQQDQTVDAIMAFIEKQKLNLENKKDM